ncbi:hypothetical protein PHJA_000247500 [Phtheirospermum japonicum]|uniref:Uncharacterized protein n=1 Tax=Phtheirospermum japonicum TaxID=374723 RepID=A0A830B5Q7_9LAMI|nr:hypothetical protein PHJA_000231900 [Phtheirospermum japonicum]GFP81042.1 hypothetical protein PHJA_000247500 [Phtheirospermum japonicum]
MENSSRSAWMSAQSEGNYAVGWGLLLNICVVCDDMCMICVMICKHLIHFPWDW